MKKVLLVLLLFVISFNLALSQKDSLYIYTVGFVKDYYIFRYDTNKIKSNGIYIDFITHNWQNTAVLNQYSVWFSKKEIIGLVEGLYKEKFNSDKVSIRKYNGKVIFDVKHKKSQSKFLSRKMFNVREKERLLNLLNKCVN